MNKIYQAIIIVCWAILAWLLFSAVVGAEHKTIERTQTGVMTIGAEVINPYDPVSTPEEPQQSATVEETYSPAIVEHQRDLTSIELGCINGDSIPVEKCER